MTREVTEAIEYIKTYRKLDENLYNTAPKGSVSFYATEKCLHYWDMAIKALEQEPILDKIRAEIIELRSKQNVGVLECLDIIDKYITELNSSYNSVKTELEPCEDCISREAAINTVVFECGEWTGLAKEISKQLRQLPSVTPQPKMGHWIGHREHCENLGVMPSGLGAYEWCSNCDCGIDVREWHRNNYNYCPRCGAKMEVEE